MSTTNASTSRRRARSRSAPASDRPTKKQKTTHDISHLYNQGIDHLFKMPSVLTTALNTMVNIGSELMRQFQAEVTQMTKNSQKSHRRKSAPKAANNNKERTTNKKPAVVIDLDADLDVEIVNRNGNSFDLPIDHNSDDFERPKLTKSRSKSLVENKNHAAGSTDKQKVARSNSRVKSAITEDTRMVVDEDEDTERTHSQLSSSAGILLLHSSQKSNKSNTNKGAKATASKNSENNSRKNRKELSSDNLPSDPDLGSQDKRRFDFRQSNSSIFVLHPQMESQIREAKAAFGDRVEIIDTTTKGPLPWIKFNSRYGNGGVKIPFLGAAQSMSVQGVFEGMKVTTEGGLDPTKFQEQSGKGLQRKGDVLGWQKGFNEEVLFGESDALWYFFIIPYKQLLTDVLSKEVAQLRQYLKENKKIVILDVERNFDVENTRRPLSHGYLLKCYLENQYPTREDINVADLY